MTTLTQPPTETRPTRRPWNGLTILGALLIALGVLWLLDHYDVFDLDTALILPLGLLAIGISLIVGSRHGEHAGLVVLGVVVSILVVAAAVAPVSSFTNGVGDVRHEPTGAIEGTYDHGLGKMVLDLTSAEVDGTVETTAEVAIGELIVIIPAGTDYRITADVAAGELDVLGQSNDGIGLDLTTTSDGFDEAVDRLVLNLEVFTGRIEVRR